MASGVPNLDPLLPHVVPWALVVFRLAGLCVMGPLVASAALPMRHRALLVVMFGAAAYPVLAKTAGGTLQLQHATTGDVFVLVPMVLGEAFVGFVIGAIAATPLLMLEMAGIVSGTTMGFGLARIYNPEMDSDTDLLGQLFFFMATGMFIAAGGVEGMFRSVLKSFERVPVGSAGFSSPLETFTGVLSSGFDLGLRASAPVVGVVLLIIIVLGALGKTIPALNTMSVGFTIKIMCGMAMLALGIYAVREPIMDAVEHAGQSTSRWLSGLEPVQR